MGKYTDLSLGFNVSMPQGFDVIVTNRRAMTFLDGRVHDLQDYITKAAYLYAAISREKLPNTNLIFDFHVDDPAYIGGGFAYRARGRQFYGKFWTERPAEIDGATVEEAQLDLKAFVEGKLSNQQAAA